LVVDVAALRALTDDELIRRHDAAVAQGGDAGARSTIYLDERAPGSPSSRSRP
jgi:hypothetical protein